MSTIDVRINAWAGDSAPAETLSLAHASAIEVDATPEYRPRDGHLAPSELADPRHWLDPRIGWGLVLEDKDDLPDTVRVDGSDAPRPLQKLLAHRKGVVLRWRQDGRSGCYLRRYYVDAEPEYLGIEGAARGVGKSQVPMYLVLGAGPSVLPWRLQYALNRNLYVGRLDPGMVGLDRYVDAAVTDWRRMGSFDPHAPLIWSVNHGHPDITYTMQKHIAAKLWNKWDRDEDFYKRLQLIDDDATTDRLLESLHDRKPNLVVTTSHGVTGPLEAIHRGARGPGELVDARHRPLTTHALTSAWSPRGAIWYAHACCAAGTDQRSQYTAYFPQDGAIGSTLRDMESLGSRVSPLPEALLGATAPLRAFVGHVEPTFDWTLMDPLSKGSMASGLVFGLYDKLFQKGATIGWALDRVFHEAGRYFGSLHDSLELAEAGMRDDQAILYYRLAGLDRQSLVILGDPAVSLTGAKGR